MIKTILYTSNPDVKVNSLNDVEDFAAAAGKYYTCITKEGSDTYGLKPGAHVLTSKGNDVYVLEVAEGQEDFDGAKKSNIVGIVSVDYPFGEPDEDLLEGMMDNFTPSKATDVKLSFQGQLCVSTPRGYITITEDGELVRVPKAMVLNTPMLVMPKPKSQVAVGDIISADNTYAKVVAIKDNKIITVSYKGSGKVVYPVKDFMMDEAYIKVVVNPFAGNQQFNPMMLAMLGDSSDDLLPLMMMQQQGQQMNPMMLLMMNRKKKNNDSLKTLMMMQMMGGNNPFAPKQD